MMYSNSCGERWGTITGYLGSFLICFNHAEIHPYHTNSIRFLKPLEPGEPNVESHIVVAPIYTEYYRDYWWNQISGLQLKLVDSTIQRDITSEFFIEAPPKPAECANNVPCEMFLQETDVTKRGYAGIVEKIRQPNGYLIKIRAVGVGDPENASIYKATWSVGWSVGPDNIDPDTSITGAIDATGRQLGNSSSIPYPSVGFTFSGTDNVAVIGFDCGLDGSAPSPCPGGTMGYSELSVGTHTFQVAAKDPAGNVDKTPATFTWTVLEQDPFPPICRTRPNLPQCEPERSQTQELPPFEEVVPEATQPPSDSDGGAGGLKGVDPNTLDQDLDGYSPATGDCDDSNIDIYPGAMEVAENGIDDNCDGTIDNAG
jgi:hypothetical protein